MILNLLGCSKDRPALLELVLRSFYKHYQGQLEDVHVTAITKATSDETQEGYLRTQSRFPHAQFVNETHIVNNIRNAFRAVTAPFTQLFVDDMVFVRPWGPADPEWRRINDGFLPEGKHGWPAHEPEAIRQHKNGLIAAVSLRMAPYMDYCYTLNVESPPPMMTSDRTWFWRSQTADWFYAHSIDGTIWRTRDVAEIFEGDRWKTLHELEPALAHGLFHRPLVVCYEEPRLVNIVSGSVQETTFNNRHPVSVENTTERFLAGERISLEAIEHIPPQRGPHFEAPYRWEPDGVARGQEIQPVQ